MAPVPLQPVGLWGWLRHENLYEQHSVWNFLLGNEHSEHLCGFSSLQDGLIQQCGETMKETITAQTVCGYYNSAGMYGLDSVKKK